MTHDAPPPRLLRDAADEGMRRDLAAAAAFDAGYDVEAGAARFDATIAELPPGPEGEGGTGAPSDAVGSGAGTAGTGSAVAVTGGALAVMGLGVVVAAVVWALADDPRPAPVVEPPTPAVERDEAREELTPAPIPEPQAPRVEANATAAADDTPTAPLDADAPANTPTAREPVRPRARSEAPTAPPKDDTLAREMAATHAAKRALGSDPARALKLARAADAEFPEGPFAEDREGIEILALYALGDREAADRRATRFLAAHPHGTYAARVKAAQRDADEKP